jgi:SAM-dependent methyltransferase
LLGELLGQPLAGIQVRTTTETLRVQFNKKGEPLLHRERAATLPLDPAHDRHKPRLLPDGEPVPFLQAIGVMTADGRVRADRQRKFRQINEFLRLLDEAITDAPLPDRPLRVVDLGCGSGALTFATYHLLNNVRGLRAEMVGVDVKAALMDKYRRIAAELGWEGLSFAAARIADYTPPVAAEPPDIVLALHACDTATDEALAQAVRWRSAVVLSAPCCHHHLQAQLEKTAAPPSARLFLRHGILRERFGDILTDGLRAHILRLLGYRTDVIEFVPVEHTPKNLLIRAVGSGALPDAALTREYLETRQAWGVTPYLETLLAAELEPLLAARV